LRLQATVAKSYFCFSVQFPDKIVDLVINFIIFLIILQLGGINNTTIAMLPEFFDKRLASWNTENIYQTPIHDLEELKLRIT
jgi:hypothetical protein